MQDVSAIPEHVRQSPAQHSPAVVKEVPINPLHVMQLFTSGPSHKLHLSLQHLP